MSSTANPGSPLLSNMAAPVAAGPPADAAAANDGAAGAAALPHDIDALQVLSVHDGQSVALTSLWHERTSIIVFLRHWM
jgi:hypothetical protein